MISEGLWKRRFGGDPAIVGEKRDAERHCRTRLSGIAPAALGSLTGDTDIWTPLTIDRAKEMRLNHMIYAIGRLKPGVTLAQAQAEMNGVSRQRWLAVSGDEGLGHRS